MKKVLITGASGFLGNALWRILYNDFILSGTYHDQLQILMRPMDITDAKAVEEHTAREKPDVVIHAAGMADVEACERNARCAHEVNHHGTLYVTDACARIGAKLVFISTDFVFDGEVGNYAEDSECVPINMYGHTKRLAEKEALRLSTTLVLRLGLLYGFNARYYPNGFFGQLMGGKPLQVNNEQPRQPLFVDDVGLAIRTLLDHDHSGIVHLTGPEKMTKYQLGVTLEKLVRPESLITPIPSSNVGAIRPKNPTLNTSLARSLGVHFRTVAEGVEEIRRRF